MNQADSLRIEEDLRGAARSRPAAAEPTRGREHLFGHRHRRSGRAPDDSPHRARQSVRAHRRHRLLRDARAGRRRASAERRSASCRTRTRIASSDELDRRKPAAERSRSGSGRRSVRRADRAGGRRSDGLHSPGADRAARSAAPTASSRRRGARAGACRSLRSREVERDAAAGFKEIALTGVHLGSYGRDLDAGCVVLRISCMRWTCAEPTSCFA